MEAIMIVVAMMITRMTSNETGTNTTTVTTGNGITGTMTIAIRQGEILTWNVATIGEIPDNGIILITSTELITVTATGSITGMSIHPETVTRDETGMMMIVTCIRVTIQIPTETPDRVTMMKTALDLVAGIQEEKIVDIILTGKPVQAIVLPEVTVVEIYGNKIKIKKMKKIIAIITAIVITAGAMAQQPAKKTTRKSKSVEQTIKTPEVATLDGKIFKITFTSKETAGSATDGSTVNRSSEVSSTSMNKVEVNSNAQFSKSDISGLNGTKAKLKFENGMMQTSIKKMMNMDNCPYRITSGTSQLATFMASCTLTANSSTDEEMNKHPQTTSSMTGTGTLKNTANGNVPDMGTPGNLGDPGSVTPRDNTRAKMDTVTGTTNASASNAYQATVYGMVSDDVISGTITFNVNGETVSYSFSGNTVSRKDKEDLGMR